MSTNKEDSGAQPSVELLDAPVLEVPKSTIGVRKIQPKKPGQRKGMGMGGTKVKTNFAELEQRAALANQFNESVLEKKLTAQEEADVVQSVRLAYQDLSIKANKEEEKLRATNPTKARQMERLGMGFVNANRTGVSHSAISDMQTISQETSGKYVTAKSVYDRDPDTRDRDRERDFFDDFTSSMYSNGSSSRKDEFNDMAASMGFETIEPIQSTPAVRSMFTPADSRTDGVNGKYANGSFKRNGFY